MDALICAPDEPRFAPIGDPGPHDDRPTHGVKAARDTGETRETGARTSANPSCASVRVLRVRSESGC
jgi:hypothetical protein